MFRLLYLWFIVILFWSGSAFSSYKNVEILPTQLDAKQINHLNTSNMDVMEMTGTLIIPLHPIMRWVGKGKYAVWQLTGFKTDKHKMFGLPWKVTGSLRGFNASLLPGYEVRMLTSRLLKRMMQAADKQGEIKLKDYHGVDWLSPYDLLIRIRHS